MQKEIIEAQSDNFDFVFSSSASPNFLSDDSDRGLPWQFQMSQEKTIDLFSLHEPSNVEVLEDILQQAEEGAASDSMTKNGSESSYQIYEFNEESSPKEKKGAGKKKKKSPGSRKKDQNLCKKYNVLAQRTLKNLKMEQIVEEYKSLKHRQDYFLIMVILARKAGKLEGFKKLYSQEIEKMKICCSQNIRHTFKDSLEYRKTHSLLEGIEKSFKCIQLYEKNKLQEATRVLFDLKNLRNRNFLDRSIQFVSIIERQIQTS